MMKNSASYSICILTAFLLVACGTSSPPAEMERGAEALEQPRPNSKKLGGSAESGATSTASIEAVAQGRAWADETEARTPTILFEMNVPIRFEPPRLAMSSSGRMILAGSYEQTFHLGGETVQNRGGLDFFVASLSPRGELQWTLRFGGAGDERVSHLAVDGEGHIVVAGSYAPKKLDDDVNLDLGGGTLSEGPARRAFVARFAPDGTHLWSRGFGSEVRGDEDYGDIAVTGLAVGPDGEVVFGGRKSGRGLNVGGGELTVSDAGSEGIFVARWSASGDHEWSWAKGSPVDDLFYRPRLTSLQINGAGRLSLAGTFRDVLTFDSDEAAKCSTLCRRANTLRTPRMWRGLPDEPVRRAFVAGFAKDGTPDSLASSESEVLLARQSGGAVGAVREFHDLWRIVGFRDDGSEDWSRDVDPAGKGQVTDVVVGDDQIIAVGNFEPTLLAADRKLADRSFAPFVATLSPDGRQASVGKVARVDLSSDEGTSKPQGLFQVDLLGGEPRALQCELVWSDALKRHQPTGRCAVVHW